MTRIALTLALVGCYTSSTTPPAAVPEEEPVIANKTPRKRLPPKPATGCDEVSCVLDNYSGNCCDKFRKGPRGAPPTAQQTTLDRSMIQTTIAALRPQITACGNTGVKGTVKVSVQVAPDGTIARLSAVSPDPSLEACVLAAVGSAVFPVTDLGGTFAYPFVF